MDLFSLVFDELREGDLTWRSLEWYPMARKLADVPENHAKEKLFTTARVVRRGFQKFVEITLVPP